MFSADTSFESLDSQPHYPIEISKLQPLKMWLINTGQKITKLRNVRIPRLAKPSSGVPVVSLIRLGCGRKHFTCLTNWFGVQKSPQNVPVEITWWQRKPAAIHHTQGLNVKGNNCPSTVTTGNAASLLQNSTETLQSVFMSMSELHVHVKELTAISIRVTKSCVKINN